MLKQIIQINKDFYAISVEDDYLNGLSMSIEYKIKIINNSETDFTGDLSKYYVAKRIFIEKAKVCSNNRSIY